MAFIVDIVKLNCLFQWKEADSSQLMDSKLKCLFLLPESNGVDGGNRDSWQSTGIASGNGDSVTIKVVH